PSDFILFQEGVSVKLRLPQSLRVAITAGKRAVPQVLGEFLVFSENILITETVRKEKEPDKYQG
ncbi:hypothetical protein, partial [Escherichia coli]|uniref:hypothetical protein n=1 Tax=Escherichia coli TaxID=562 RepID=UPI0030C66674